jgi:hypothetical protein
MESLVDQIDEYGIVNYPNPKSNLGFDRTATIEHLLKLALNDCLLNDRKQRKIIEPKTEEAILINVLQADVEALKQDVKHLFTLLNNPIVEAKQGSIESPDTITTTNDDLLNSVKQDKTEGIGGDDLDTTPVEDTLEGGIEITSIEDSLATFGYFSGKNPLPEKEEINQQGDENLEDTQVSDDRSHEAAKKFAEKLQIKGFNLSKIAKKLEEEEFEGLKGGKKWQAGQVKKMLLK